MELARTILKYCAFMLLLPVILSANYGSSRELIVCRMPENFQIQVSDYHSVEVYANELLIRYNNIGLYLYPGTNTVSVVLNETSIEFQAYMRSADFVNLNPLAERIRWTSSGILTGHGQLQRTNEQYYRVRQYRFCLPTNSTKSSNLFKAVEDKVRRYAQLCVETEISKSTNYISKKSFKHFKEINDFEPVIILPQLSKDFNSNEINVPVLARANSLEFNINDLVDLGLGAMIDMIKAYNLDKIKLPDINQVFTSDMKIFDVKGNLQASNGTFVGVTTLLRTADVVLSRQGRKYTASCGFGMTNALVEYAKYKFKYGVMELCGSIIGNVKNIALESKISVDYNAPRCVTKLESIKITEFGNMKVKFTGSGVMNTIGSKLISWFTKLFKNNIKGILERDLETFLTNRISSIDCERYRRKVL
ncbi:hypothetical protein KPH14_001874 [Odynerus spinipes]|uniref:Uncharacterized protein n=1 Tax=Odynerus spinipes TaxID=1348599 RepID=A0AAD9RZY2_9HYME|nr:hypothetical protein KPH14_001874 [Odynerus spinipes]